MTSFYATLRTRSRGALPLLSADSSPTLRGARGQAPCTPKIAPFRLPSSVTLFLGRSGPRKSVPQTNFFPQSLHAQRCVFARVLPLFLMSIDPHAGQQSGVVFVVLAWCWACDGRSPRCPELKGRGSICFRKSPPLTALDFWIFWAIPSTPTEQETCVSRPVVSASIPQKPLSLAFQIP